MCRYIYLQVCVCVFCSQRHANETNGQKSLKNGSSPKAGHSNLKFLFEICWNAASILEKAQGSKKNPVVLKVYGCGEKSVLATTATRASRTAHKLDEAQLGLVSSRDSSGMIHSEISVKKGGICFFLSCVRTSTFIKSFIFVIFCSWIAKRLNKSRLWPIGKCKSYTSPWRNWFQHNRKDRNS